MEPGEAHLLDDGFGGRLGSITPYPKPKKLDMPPWKAKANDGHSFLRARSEHVLTQLHSWGKMQKRVARNTCAVHNAVRAPFSQSLCFMHTGKPTGVAVSHCITWFQTQQILTTCQIRYHSHCGVIVALDSSEP